MKLKRYAYLRIVFYILFFAAFAAISLKTSEKMTFCVFYNILGLKCPGCGTTRAFVRALHSDVSGAFALNPMFVTLLLPAFLITAVQDTAVIIYRLISKKDATSFVEFAVLLISGRLG